MSLLEGDVSGFFSAAFAGFFLDAQLYRPNAFADNGKGGGSGGSGFADPEPVKAQLDQVTQAMRSSEGFVDSDQRILVLASGIAPITTDCEISVGGTRWQIASVSQDPARSYYELRGRRKANA
jgi:hypothetical protein